MLSKLYRILFRSLADAVSIECNPSGGPKLNRNQRLYCPSD
jgi:hypothetical protein